MQLNRKKIMKLFKYLSIHIIICINNDRKNNNNNINSKKNGKFPSLKYWSKLTSSIFLCIQLKSIRISNDYLFFLLLANFKVDLLFHVST